MPAYSVSEAAVSQGDERGRLIGAIGSVLRETVGAFEGTVSRITELTVLHQKGTAGRDLVVALQEFDRLQQEFATLGHLLEQLSGSGDGPAAYPGAAELLSAITIAGLKKRLAATINDSDTDGVTERPGDRVY
jgi:hypothetical protein